MILFRKACKHLLQIDYLIWVPSRSVGGKQLLIVKKTTNTFRNVYKYAFGGLKHPFAHSLTLQYCVQFGANVVLEIQTQ